MGAIDLASAITDPEHVGRTVVPVARQRILARQGLLVGQDERLVAGVEVDAGELVVLVEVDPAGAHEGERPVDVVGEHLVALTLGRVGDELLIPRVHARQGGEPAGGEGAQAD